MVKKKNDLSPIHLTFDADIHEVLINQQLIGLRFMPQALPRIKAMAKRGDPIAAEVVKRFEAERK